MYSKWNDVDPKAIGIPKKRELERSYKRFADGGTGEMIQYLRALADCSSGGLGFHSHLEIPAGIQVGMWEVFGPSILPVPGRSVVLFWSL